jgi:hypothetical protein
LSSAAPKQHLPPLKGAKHEGRKKTDARLRGYFDRTAYSANQQLVASAQFKWAEREK